MTLTSSKPSTKRAHACGQFAGDVEVAHDQGGHAGCGSSRHRLLQNICLGSGDTGRSPSDGETTEEGIIAWCAERLASFRVPSTVDFVGSLPRTAVGKIQKHVLKEDWMKRKAGA